MRVIYRTPPIPGATARVKNGPTLTGYAHFVAAVFDPGENVPPGYDPKRMAVWRTDSFTQSDGSMRVKVLPFISPPPGVGIPDAVIPSALLKTLPDDALLSVAWHVSVGVPK